MAFQHARRAAAERPQPNRAIPGRRRQRRAIGRNRERHDRRGVSLEDLVGLLAAGVQIAIFASAPAVTMRPSLRKATAFTASAWNRSTCSADSACQRPADRRCIETARKHVLAVGRDRNGTHRAAMAGELGVSG